MTPTAWIHVVTLICHTVVIVCIVIATAVLASSSQLDPATITFLTAIGSGTTAGLVINGRKVPPGAESTGTGNNSNSNN